MCYCPHVMDELLEARRDRGAQVQTQVLNHWAWCHLPPPPSQQDLGPHRGDPPHTHTHKPARFAPRANAVRAPLMFPQIPLP